MPPYKTANASRSFGNNYAQMSTIIKKSLEIQIRLYDALKPCDFWQDRPVVWVLVNKGSVWEVSAAYPRRVQGEVCSKIRYPPSYSMVRGPGM
ncbi:hypothetical protein HYQ45_002425 [Verticillium longisporum]|uniref:Uncharacterized protein n=1 Tax=Verticillium longisporum TaxID=100787 RepID=A0A8I2ZYC1_VERLO|nr:hypothetical protein HYQ45_002425 [Verticillium longisporum]